MKRQLILFAFLAFFCGHSRAAESPDVETLRNEVRTKGWIAFAARTEKGDMDLFICHPDGSEKRNITQTPDFNEAYPLFSRDVSQVLFRRLVRNETIDGNNYGSQGHGRDKPSITSISAI